MEKYLKKALMLVVATLLLSAWLVKADYYQQLKQIEAGRLDDLQATKQALDVIEAEKEQFSPEERSLYLLVRGHSAAMHSNFSEAERVFQKLLESEAKVDYKGRAHSILASILHVRGDYEDAFMHLDKALSFIPEMDDKTYKTNILQNAVNFYSDSEMLDYAMSHARRLLKSAIKDKHVGRQCYANFEMLTIELSAQRLELVDKHIATVRELCEKGHETLPLLQLPSLEADVMLSKGQAKEAKQLLEDHFPKVQEYDWEVTTALFEIKMAQAYLALKEYEEAEKVALRAYKTSDRINDIKRTRNATKVLAKIYTEKKSTDKALEFYQKYMELEQKFNTKIRQRKLAFDRVRQMMHAAELARLESN